MKQLLLSLILLTTSLGVTAAPQDGRPPLSKDELHDLLSSSTPSRVIVSTIQSSGIAFQPTDDVIEEFRRAGADKAVLAALRQAWHAEIPKPLSDKEIRMMLAEDVPSENISAAVLVRGVDFQPSEDYLADIRSGGAADALISTLRAAVPRPFSKDELVQHLRSLMDQDWIARQIQQRGIDFEPGNVNLQALRNARAQPSLLEAVKTAKRVKPFVAKFPPPPQVSSPLVRGKTATLICEASDKDVPVFADPHDLGNVAARLRCGESVTFMESVASPPGFDRIQYHGGKEGFVSTAYLEFPIATVGGGVTAPSKIHAPEPPYTPEARRDRIEGVLRLLIVIDTQGHVADVQESSPPLGEGLDKSAIDTVKTWRFAPSTRGGIPVPVRVNVEVSFHLHNETR